MREPLLEAFVPTAVLLGHAAGSDYCAERLSCDILEAGGCCSSWAAPYQRASNSRRAAKDYQAIFYKSPLADEAKPAALRKSQVMHALGKEYTYPGVEMQGAAR